MKFLPRVILSNGRIARGSFHDWVEAIHPCLVQFTQRISTRGRAPGRIASGTGARNQVRVQCTIISALCLEKVVPF